MEELFRCQTGSGKLVVTEDGVFLARPAFGITGTRTESVMKPNIAGADVKVMAPPVFGMGGAMTFHLRLQGGSVMEIKAVPWKEAKQLKAWLGIPDI